MRQNKDEIISFLQKREETRQKALETIANRNVEDPELAMFSDYVKNVLQKLPSTLKVKAKKEICDVLVKYEYESLNVEASTPMLPAKLNSPELSADSVPRTNQNTLSTYNFRAYSPISQAVDMDMEATDLSLIRIITEDDEAYD